MTRQRLWTVPEYSVSGYEQTYEDIFKEFLNINIEDY
jgi:hypothetical protein